MKKKPQTIQDRPKAQLSRPSSEYTKPRLLKKGKLAKTVALMGS